MRWPRVSWRAAIAGLAVAMLGLVSLAGLVFLSRPGRQWVLARIEQTLALQGIRFQARSIDYRLFSPRVTIDAPEFSAPGGQILTATRLDIDIDGRVVELTLTAPRLTLALDKLPVWPSGRAAGSSFTVGKIRIIDGSLSLQDHSRAIAASLDRWQALATRTPDGHYRVGFATNGPGQVSYRGRTESIESIRLSYAGSRIEKLEISSSAGSLDASGAVEPNLDLSIRASPNLTRLVAELKGTASANIRVIGSPDKPIVSGDVSAANLYWKNQGPAGGTTHFAWNESMDRLRLSAVQANWGGASIGGRAEIAPTGQTSANFSFAGLDTRQLEAALGRKIPVVTQLSGNVSAAWPGLDGFASATGRATLVFSAWRGQLNLSADGNTVKAVTKGIDTGALVLRADAAMGRRSRVLEGTLALDAADAGAAARLLKLELPAMTGAITLEATLAGTLSEPAASFQLASPGLRVANAPETKLTARGHATLEEIRVDSLEARAGNTRAELSGRALLTSGDAILNFDGTLDRTPLAAFTTLAEGAVTGTFAIRGSARQPEASARLELASLRAYGAALGDGKADVRYDASGLAVPRLELVKGTGTIVASAQESTNRIDAEIRSFAIESDRGIGGIVNGKANFQGPSLEAGAGTMNLSVTNLVAAGRKPGDVELSAALAGGTVKATASAPAWGITSTVQASVRAPYAATAEATLRNFALENVAAITGSATGSINASGNLAEPDSLKAAADLTRLTVKSGGEEASNAGPVRIRYAAGLADIDSATFTSGDSKITLRGQVPVQKGEAALTFEGDLDVALAARLAALDPALGATGRLRAKGTLAGAAPNWQPDGTVELTGGGVNVPGMQAPVTAAQASVSVRQGIVSVTQATASWLGGTIRLTGEAPVTANQYRLQAEASGLRLDQLGTPSQLAGVINLKAEAEAKGLGVRDIVARIEAPGLRLQMGDLELSANKSTPAVTVRNGLLQIQDFALSGAGTEFEIRGSAALIEPYPLAVRIDGDLDAALAGLFTDALSAQGRAKLQVALTGTTVNPRLGGSIELNGVQATIPRAGAVLENLNARADLLGQQVTLSAVSGTLNGGTLTGGGTAELKNGALSSVALQLQSRNSAWNIPEGLETAANIDLSLAGTRQQLTLGGDIQILEGSYRERLVIERGLLNALQPTASSAANANAPAAIPINLNVRVRTSSPILVSNDLLNGALNVDLRFRGTPQRPGLTGRVDLEEGGTLYLGGRNYLAERASATFTNERKIEPVLDVLAQTKAGGRQITLEARGAMGSKLDTHFTSDDGLPEPDVLALLVTGRTLRETRGAEADIAGDQALSYLAGSVGGTLSQQANRALGFNFVRIDPSLIAQEAEPTARLTLGQDITDRVGLVYSVNLRNSTDQIWIGRVDVTRRFSARVVRQSDNSYRLQFQHDVEFGGEAPPKRKKAGSSSLRVGLVTIAGNSPVPEPELRKRFGLRTGRTYDFFQLRKGIDRVKDSLARKGYPEAIVRAERKAPAKGTVDLALTITAGAPVQFVYEGAGISGRVRRKVERAWSENSFDSLRSRQAKAVLQEHLASDGYLEASVDPAVRQNPNGGKFVLFEIARGDRHRRVEVAFPGASAPQLGGLRELFRDKQARLTAILKPEQSRALVAAHYRALGYLESTVKPRTLDRSQPATLRVVWPITEGDRYRVGNVTMAAAEKMPSPLVSGTPYVPAEADRGAERLVEALEEKGFTAAEAVVEVAPDREAKTVAVTYRVTPGERKILGGVDVEGNRLTSDRLIRSQIGVAPGEPITSQKLSQARRNLYDTGAFAFTDLELQPGGSGTRLLARVREVRPFELRYGALFDTEKGPGGIVDFSARNVLGAARVAGFRGRYDGQLREARAYFEQPNLLRFPMKWVTTGFVRREINEGFLTDRAGGSTTAEFRWRRVYRLNAGYRLEQVHTFEKEPDPVFPFDIRIRIAPLTAGFQRDTRNDILDPRRGSYFSHIGEWAPAALGSQLRYAKYFGQYFHYRPLLGERRFANAPSRPGLVFAGGVRFGIASGLGGQELIPSERFFSGGGTSVRGFAQDTLGALPGRTPAGGEGLWIANAEARIPLFKYADIVGFLDAGNVYRRWDDLSLSGARFSMGLGLRIRTPYILLRLDYGIKLNRRPGESFGRLFGGLGQAF